MRGNRRRRVCGRGGCGSIPAYAGEPADSPARPDAGRVYPRVCGGTLLTCWMPGNLSGLSPRMRGNPVRPRAPPARSGSIPAYAGEPGHRGGRAYRNEVYPRVCGGTRCISDGAAIAGGLSPRMRGNRRNIAGRGAASGSIPAYAGEPVRLPERRAYMGVYPRVCGGTLLGHRSCAGRAGLSPRMRGNPSAGDRPGGS